MAIADLIKIPPVQAFLADGSVMTVFRAILEKFALPTDRAIELLDLTDAVLDGALTVDQFPAMLAEAFGVELPRAQKIACDVVGFRLLPLEEYIPGVAAQITEWGGDLSKYPKSRVGKTKMSAETFAAQLDEKLELNFSEVLIKRCAFLLYAYWNKEKTKESTLTFFSRGQTIGGLGLSPELAQKLLAGIDESRDTIDVISGGEQGAPGSRQLGVGETVNSGEVAVKEIEEQFAKSESETSLPLTKGESEGVAAVGTVLELSPSHELTSELPIINAPKAPVPTSHIDDSWKGELKEAEKKARQVVSSGEGKGQGAVGKTEQSAPPKNDVLDKRFAAITKDASSEHLEPILPDARVSLARSVKEETAQQAQAIPEEKLMEAAVASRPVPVKPMLTVGSVAPQHTMRPMTDVQTVKRLVGPIDELATMTPVEFRRLSTVPADAAQKIEDILSTIESQSYEERVKGVKAWRQSPMNQLYVLMTTDALTQGVGLAEIATRRRSAGEESLSPAEIRAVSALNERLRF
ncbi:MAG: hypothetical protein AAB473_04840 [Patescibacteria group bacterium]